MPLFIGDALLDAADMADSRITGAIAFIFELRSIYDFQAFHGDDDDMPQRGHQSKRHRRSRVA